MATERRRAFFGRRQGKGLRQGQSERVERLIPALRIDPRGRSRAWFPQPVDGVHLEIGFGAGNIWPRRREAHPQIGYIGCEAYRNGRREAGRGHRAGRPCATSGSGTATRPISWRRCRTDRSTASICSIPIPGPKRRQRKRRLVSDAFLATLARVMRPGGKFRFATDIDDYAGWTLARVLRSRKLRLEGPAPGDWRKPWAGWPGTRYEAKAVRKAAGRAI
jgi:tRNA (guanine-N7-)-methyltransferase